jgi:anti-sigma factor RsiW
MVVNCEHVWREISNYLDGEVDPETRFAIELHFAQCKHCTAVLDGARNVVQLYGDDSLFELPAGFSRRLQRRLADASSSSHFAGWQSFWMLAVAAVALVVGTVTFGNSRVFSRPDLRSRLAQSSPKIPPELMVAVSSEGRIFHVPGCKYLHNKVGESPELCYAFLAHRVFLHEARSLNYRKIF